VYLISLMGSNRGSGTVRETWQVPICSGSSIIEGLMGNKSDFMGNESTDLCLKLVELFRQVS